MTGQDRERGATAVEYAIMVSGIAVVIAGTVGIVGTRVAAMFEGFLAAMGWT